MISKSKSFSENHYPVSSRDDLSDFCRSLVDCLDSIQSLAKNVNDGILEHVIFMKGIEIIDCFSGTDYEKEVSCTMSFYDLL